MSRKHHQVTFKPYELNQPRLLPPRLDELVPEHHLVGVVNCALAQIKRDPRLAQSKGGGTSRFHPKRMLQVLVYAYTQRL